jgi:hypothetical protein
VKLPHRCSAGGKWPRGTRSSKGPRTETDHVLDSVQRSFSTQSLWSFADVVTGTLVPRGRREDESAEFPAPVLCAKYGERICGSQTNITEPTYHTWPSTSLFTLSGVICSDFVTAFMTRRPLAILGPRPPLVYLYSRLSVPFMTLLPPLLPVSSHHPLLLHPFLLAWHTLPLQDVPDPPPLRPVNPVKRTSPLKGNTERCSRMVPAKSGLRASRKFSSMVR